MKKLPGFSLIAILVTCLILFTIILVPLKIIGYGFLPPDDALRHAAKVISDKSWDQILLIRHEFKLDSHPGWNTILTLAHKATGWDQEGLVVFSVVLLFLIFCLPAIFFLEFPEVWLLSLFTISLVNVSFIRRLFYGRPFLVTVTSVITLCLVWPRLRKAKFWRRQMFILTFLFALSAWIHATWYLFMLPVFCFFLAREWKAGFRVTLAAICGVLMGAIFTGRPVLFFKQTFIHALLSLGDGAPARVLAFEFQPFNGDILTVIVVCLVIILIHLRGRWDIKNIDNPVFILAVLGWSLGFLVQRFWIDWGLPALCVWLAQTFQVQLKNIYRRFFGSRIIFTFLIATLFYLSLTNDIVYHWSDSLTQDYLKENNPQQVQALPEPGGIIYSDDMTLFYQSFFQNPHAPWQYDLGFEPAWMLPEDLAILRRIQTSFFRDESYEPWVRKMRPQDRLILRRPIYQPPSIPGLEWYYVANKIWAGKPLKK